MVIIVDDTFVDRYKSHDIDFLREEKYQKVCKIYSIVKTVEISQMIKNLTDCDIFCNHKTLQLFDNVGEPLNAEDNAKYREALLIKVEQERIHRIEFSGGLETIFENNKIDKHLFYNNLKAFLDYYIRNNQIEHKILFWGTKFIEIERLTSIQKMFMQIRTTRIEDFLNNRIIQYGIQIIYPTYSPDKIIEGWINNNKTKNDIIKEINNQII